MKDFGLKRYICLIFGIFARGKNGRVICEGPVTNERKDKKSPTNKSSLKSVAY
jgi:hypothetical protein